MFSRLLNKNRFFFLLFILIFFFFTKGGKYLKIDKRSTHIHTFFTVDFTTLFPITSWCWNMHRMCISQLYLWYQWDRYRSHLCVLPIYRSGVCVWDENYKRKFIQRSLKFTSYREKMIGKKIEVKLFLNFIFHYFSCETHFSSFSCLSDFNFLLS